MKQKCKYCFHHATLEMSFDWRRPFQKLRKEIICESDEYENSHIPDAKKCGHFLKINKKEWNKYMKIDYTTFLHEQEQDKYVIGFKNRLIRFFGLKGSWKWAKRQMMKGEIVKCNHWSGTLKLKIDKHNNTLLQHTFSKNTPYNFETANHFLNNELYTDYVIVS